MSIDPQATINDVFRGLCTGGLFQHNIALRVNNMQEQICFLAQQQTTEARRQHPYWLTVHNLLLKQQAEIALSRSRSAPAACARPSPVRPPT